MQKPIHEKAVMASVEGLLADALRAYEPTMKPDQVERVVNLEQS